MFRSLGTLAAFTLLGAVLYKYNQEIFGETVKPETNPNSKTAPAANPNPALQNNAGTTTPNYENKQNTANNKRA